MEKVIEKFNLKFENYKNLYNNEFLKLKLENIFKEQKIKNVFINYYKYNLNPNNSYFFSEILGCDEEKKYFSFLKNTISINGFSELLKSLNLSGENFQEEYFFGYTCLFFLMKRFGKIKDVELFKNIIFMWILVDNIIDDPEKRKYEKLIVNVKNFLFDKIYEKETESFFDLNKDDPLLKILKNISSSLEKEKKVSFFNCCRNLFLFSYNRKKNNDGVINTSLKKCFLSLEIFLFTLTEKTISDEDYFTTCLFLQIIDDLLDMKKDIREKSETFVLKCSERERNIIILILLEINKKNLSETHKLISISVLQSLLQNREMFGKEIFDILNNILDINLLESKFKDTKEFYKCVKHQYS